MAYSVDLYIIGHNGPYRVPVTSEVGHKISQDFTAFLMARQEDKAEERPTGGRYPQRTGGGDEFIVLNFENIAALILRSG